jgi:curved DNA-binding protein CbpA
MTECYYKILEVHPEAGIEVIEKAYRTLAMRFHPDKNPPHRQKWAEEKFKSLSHAYSVLRDPVQRRDYDRERWGREALHGTSADVPAAGPREEQAYFHFRTGLNYLEKADKASAVDILIGKDEVNREKAKTEFETVLKLYPQSTYCEETYYRWLVLLNGRSDYSEAFLKKAEEAFEEFFDKFPAGSWSAEAKLEYARFLLLKRRNERAAKKILHYLAGYYSSPELMREVEALRLYVEENQKVPIRPREKVRG